MLEALLVRVVGGSFAERYVDSMLGKKNILIEYIVLMGFFSYVSVTFSTSDYSAIGQLP